MDAKSKSSSNRNAKILVADDSLTIQKVIKLALASEGYDIQTASDAQDTLQSLTVFRPQVVLVDVSLPGKNAFEIKRQVNEQGDLPDTRFILMSSAFEKVDENQASEVVFHGRLTKPFDPSLLRKVVNEVLQEVHAARTEATTFIERPRATTVEIPSLEVPPPLSLDPLTPEESHPSAPPPLEGMPSTQPPPLELNFPPLPDQLEPIIPMDEGPSPIPGPPPGSGPDADIRILTESTIQMTGLDEMSWSIREPQPRPIPPPVPGYSSNQSPDEAAKSLGVSRSSVTQGRNAFRVESIEDSGNAESSMPPFIPDRAQTIDLNAGGIKLESSERMKWTTGLASTPEGSVDSPASLPTDPLVEGSLPLTSHQIEELVSREVEARLKKMAQGLLPDIAERIVKQEIRRILSEEL
jgi:CheY-like chemotaxis protein